MERTNPIAFFRQTLKSDAYYADELISIYLLRPIAAAMVWILSPTAVTPNEVTVAAIMIGLLAAYSYLFATPAATALAGVLIVLKDIADDADGQLARAKQMYSRRGRFLDSIGDFVVDIAVFGAITLVCYRWVPNGWTLLLGFLAFWGITLRVSYHVYYQVSFLHLEDRYKLNRITEEITEADRAGDPLALRLQRIFVVLYGWQDWLMYRIDQWCKGKGFDERLAPTWYSDRSALRLSGLLGFGTELMVLAICSWCNAIFTYLFLNIFLMNGIWIVNILYRRLILARNLK